MEWRSVTVVRRACTAGRLIACAGLITAAAIMLRVISNPAALGPWAAALLLVTVFIAFLADRFLASVMDHVDRFEAAGIRSESSARPSELREAA